MASLTEPAAVDDAPRPQYETGLILALPQLAAFTSRWRATSYARDHPGLPIERRFPPHVTLLTPWAPVEDVEAMARLRAVAAAAQPLELEFASAQMFADSGVVYLAPTRVPPLAALFDDLIGAFPEHPPYEGRFDTVVPHLTVSADGSAQVLAEVRAALAENGPVRTEVDRICVFGRDDDDVWRQAAAVALGSGDLLDGCAQPPQPDAIA